MMKSAFLSLVNLLIVMHTSLFAQQPLINGEVKGYMDQPIPFVTIILQKTDSTYVDATITDSLGKFRFHHHMDSYRLIAQHLSYETRIIDECNTNFNIIHLQVKKHVIPTITIAQNRPFVQSINGKLIYDIDQIIEAKVVSNIYDVLLEIPGIYQRGDKMSLAGAPNVMILIDGRPSSMSSTQVNDILKQMPVSHLESIEIMYSTPPQYNVRGASINIITRGTKKKTLGFTEEVNLNYSQKYFSNLSGGATILYSSEKIVADFLYTISDIKRRSTMDLLSHHDVAGTIYDIEQYNWGFNKKQLHTGRLNFDFKIGTKDWLRLGYNTIISRNVHSIERSDNYVSNSLNEKSGNGQIQNISIDYTSRFGLGAGVNYTYFNSSSLQDFSNDGLEMKSHILSNDRQRIDKVLVYTNQNHMIGKGWDLNYGVKYTFARDRDYQYYQNITGDINHHNTDNIIQEHILDLYIGSAKNFSEKLSFNFSITGEYYKLVNNNEWTLFPQASVSFSSSSSSILQFGLSSNKEYPSYWAKQDYVGYFNGYAQVRGNPLLMPSDQYSIQLSYIRNRKYVFTLYYSYMPKYAEQLAYQLSNELTLIYKTQNWDYLKVFGLNMVIPFKIFDKINSRFSLNNYFQFAKNRFFYDISFNNKKFVSHLALDNNITIFSKPDIKATISGFYYTKSLQGIYSLSEIWGINTGIKWSFSNKKAELGLSVIDVFDSSTPSIYVNQHGQNFKMFLMEDARQVKISLRYKFKGYKARKRNEIDESRFGH